MEEQPLQTFRVGTWRVEPSCDAISRGGTTVRLVPRSMKVLCVLAQHAGGVVSQAEIERAAWPNVVVTSSSIYQAITDLRRTLGDDKREPTYIETVPRKGYRLIAPVAPDEPVTLKTLNTPDAPITPVPADSTDSPGQLVAPAIETRAPRTRRRVAYATVMASTLAMAIAAGWTLVVAQSAKEAPLPKSIAVLPLADLSESANSDRFADGLAEEMMSTLGQVPGFRVASRTSALAFKGYPKDVRSIGHALGPRFVVEGSIRRGRGRIRVTAQLIDTTTGYQLWSSSFDRPADDLLAVQQEIASAIAQGVQLKLE